MSPVRYELGFYIPEDAIPHSHCREGLKSYIVLYTFCNFLVLLPLSVTAVTRRSEILFPFLHKYFR
jgi:hypothetical protein